MKSATESYTEQQRFRQWWLWTIVLIGPFIMLIVFLPQMITDYATEEGSNTDYWIILFVFCLGFGPVAFIYLMKLDTAIQKDGLYIKFKPFHRKWIIFPFETITQATAITYRPLRDYGGWGIRYGGKGKAYNVSGNKGVLLELETGKTLLIGSQKYKNLCLEINKHLI